MHKSSEFSNFQVSCFYLTSMSSSKDNCYDEVGSGGDHANSRHLPALYVHFLVPLASFQIASWPTLLCFRGNFFQNSSGRSTSLAWFFCCHCTHL